MILPLGPVMGAFQEPVPRTAPVRAAVNNPQKLPFSPSFVNRLKAPAGYRVTLFASNLVNPRVLMPLADGTVLVSSPDSGRIYALKEGQPPTVALDGKSGVHGLAKDGNEIYFATQTEIYVARMGDNMRLKDVRRITGALPEAGQHWRRTIGIGPDGMLYVSIGSRTNDRVVPEPQDACILRMNKDGTGTTIFAKGLRNTIAFGWHPKTKALFGVDQGNDFRGDDLPPEEINEIKEGKHYGWPYVYADRKVDPQVITKPEGYASLEAFAATTEASLLTIPAHSSPIDMAWDGEDMLLALRGSWNRSKPAGYKVVRVIFENGRPTKVEDFLSGFVGSGGYIGRPTGVAKLADGSILVCDDTNGAVYRVAKG